MSISSFQKRKCFFIGIIVLHLASFVSAGHFNYATLSWQQLLGDDVQPNTVRFTLQSAWSTEYSPYKSQAPSGTVSVNDMIRIQGLGNPVLEFGDGQNQLLTATVVAVDPVLSIWQGVSVVDHVYTSAQSSYLATFSGCCRANYLMSNAGEFWNVTSKVDMSFQKEGWTFSPHSSNLARVAVRANQVSSFYVAAYSPGAASEELPNGRRLQWSIGSSFDHGGSTNIPINQQAGITAISIDAGRGLVTVQAQTGVYCMVVKIVDLDMDTSTIVDFELQAAPQAGINIMPSFDLSYPASPAPLRAYRALFVGFQDTFVIRFNESGAATSLPIGATVPMSSNGRPRIINSTLPQTASLGPLTVAMFPPVSGIIGYNSVFTWTPSSDQVNETIICFAAYGNNSNVTSPQLCVDFDVQPDPAPQWVGNGSCIDDINGTTCYPNGSFSLSPQPMMGKKVTAVLIARDQNVYENISISGVNLPTTSNVVLGGQVNIDQSGYRQVTRTFVWSPGPMDGGRQSSLCFDAQGAMLNSLGQRIVGNVAPRLCMQFTVQKCIYRVGPAEALVDIGRKFQVSWLQLWALNKWIQRPEGYGMQGTIQAGDMIHVGQLIVTKRGDSLERIAARFGITVLQLLAMNQDVQPTVGLLLGQAICVIPNSCSQS